jgi:hypothetical protein
MDDGHAFAVFIDGILDGRANQALGTLFGDRLDADGRCLGETDLGDPELFLQYLY